MKARLIIAAMICVAPLTAAARAAEIGGATQHRVERTLRAMSLDEKVGHMIMSGTAIPLRSR